jgi:hypothetical protein
MQIVLWGGTAAEKVNTPAMLETATGQFHAIADTEEIQGGTKFQLAWYRHH